MRKIPTVIFLSILMISNISSSASLSDAAKERFRQGLEKPDGQALLECMGVQVFKDPQPPGHPLNEHECAAFFKKEGLEWPIILKDGTDTRQAIAEAHKNASILRAHAYVKRLLKDEDTAKFRGEFMSADLASICGEVNARNSFGAMAGYERFIARGDGVALESQSGERFQVAWKQFCDPSSASDNAIRSEHFRSVPR
jgi:hypothetical protein